MKQIKDCSILKGTGNISQKVVDMRWGVRDEATDDHMTTELCMKEIDNCQRLSMGPNFVVSLYKHQPSRLFFFPGNLVFLVSLWIRISRVFRESVFLVASRFEMFVTW